MKMIHSLIILTIGLFFLCSCAVFYDKQTVPVTPKPLALPVGENWQVIEKAPNLSNEKGSLPFQSEQSVQPEGAKPASPAENRTIEISH